jgi:diphosphomevalonate decarboxylase
MIAEMNKTNNKPLQVTADPEDGYHVGWQCPSNIALVKYWGKTGNQVPMNPSLSITLDGSVTKTLVHARRKENRKDAAQLKYIFEGKENEAFREKILVFIKNQSSEFPFLQDYDLEMESSNTFPHSAGIASSASSMGALALCLLSLDSLITGKKLNIHTFLKKASHIARLGSGSASRSLYGEYVLWGKLSMIPKSGNLSAIPLPVKPNPVFANLQDSILVIDQSEKPVSSRAGHEKMYNHPFRKGRIFQVDKNLRQIINALGTGDWNAFSNAVENEALTLHGLMMSSDPGILLIQPNSLKAIEKIRAFRTRENIKITFTLDAGPNLHLLYPEEDAQVVRKFISQELTELCVNNYVIYDRIGHGPVQII